MYEVEVCRESRGCCIPPQPHSPLRWGSLACTGVQGRRIRCGMDTAIGIHTVRTHRRYLFRGQRVLCSLSIPTPSSWRYQSGARPAPSPHAGRAGRLGQAGQGGPSCAAGRAGSQGLQAAGPKCSQQIRGAGRRERHWGGSEWPFCCKYWVETKIKSSFVNNARKGPSERAGNKVGNREMGNSTIPSSPAWYSTALA